MSPNNVFIYHVLIFGANNTRCKNCNEIACYCAVTALHMCNFYNETLHALKSGSRVCRNKGNRSPININFRKQALALFHGKAHLLAGCNLFITKEKSGQISIPTKI